ncbi:MAG: hypothetical protein HETSPECPRED_000377 [Heterodermia speciosa]|uniref:Phosducin thioredoxin-like domain-containing protein n=1 Tax=Heterodermia speciosa TaxID=116794 RepID=A0A8H3ERW0_9LECA|nr:MAG: hypothetical protein HETSPECPRED_000377 [Heterodermia speciosa]
MAPLDSTVAQVLDTHNLSSNEDVDEDALLDSLDDDSTLNAFREQRRQQLHSEFARAKNLRNQEHGTYTEIKDEKALMEITTSTKWCVVHFFKSDFGRCGIMDGKIEALTPKHFDTRFLRINVENAPFLVTKLKIQVLPCVLTFVDGVSKDRIVGFEGLGYGEDTFTAKDLEARLLKAGVLARGKVLGNELPSTARRQQAKVEEDNDDWD